MFRRFMIGYRSESDCSIDKKIIQKEDAFGVELDDASEKRFY